MNKAANDKLKFFKSKIPSIILVSFLIFIICAFFGISYVLPHSVVITENESPDSWLPQSYSWLVSTKDSKTAPAMQNRSAKIGDRTECESYLSRVYLCGIVPIKTVEVSVVGDMYVIPGGETIGINLKTRGLIVVGIAQFDTATESSVSPAKDTGIRAGDVINKIDGIEFSKAEDMSNYIKSQDKAITIQGTRGNKAMSWELTPERDKADNTLKIGIWVRESIAGIGTVSFYNGDQFAALGHPITDIDTGDAVETTGGTICNAKIIGVDKGEKGSPGSLKGVFSGENIGTLSDNSYCGIYGTIDNLPDKHKIMLASEADIRQGSAKLCCDTGGGCKSYDIEIIRLASENSGTRSMIIKITDEELLKKTGGIVQGMSGSPIIQDGKLVGALTHVFVNDPTKGYAVLAQTMVKEMIK